MHKREFILLGVVATAFAAPVQAARPPDAHVVRPYRGDILEIRDGVTAPRPATYVAPYRGWTYSAPRVGQRLRPGFWNARYVVAGPRGVPAARGSRKWIRYGDDLLLIDARDGRVKRVVDKGYLKAV